MLAGDKVLWAGQPVALVVADTPERAADAAELVVVDYDELPAVTAALDAAAGSAPLLHEGAPSNVAFRKRLTAGDADAGVRTGRLPGQPADDQPAPRPGGDGAARRPRRTPRPTAAWRCACRPSAPTAPATWLAKILGLPVRPRSTSSTGDVGGGFGAKGPLYPDQVAVIAAARALGQPVKWIEERSESFTATTHGRDQVADLELAADAGRRHHRDARHRARELRRVLHPERPRLAARPPRPDAAAGLPPRALRRRAGRRLREHDADRPVPRRRAAPRRPTSPSASSTCSPARWAPTRPSCAAATSSRPSDFPYTTVTGLTYETGDYQAGLDLLLEKLKKPAQPARPAEAPPRLTRPGQLLGRGIATFVEPGGIVPRVPGPDGTIGDKATVTVGPDGKVTVAVGTSGHGQGHETAFAQLAADLLGVPYDDVTVVFGDTDTAPFGYGTFGSRSLAAGGTAIYNACQAALDAARRVDAPMPVAEAAARLGGISASGSSGALPETYASGAYGCDVAVDPDTGQVTLLRVVAVDDCGVLVNPLLVEGQVHGAVAQGVGQALTEQVSYDENGQPMSASLMDYAVPFAATMPHIESYSVVTPSTLNPLGVKGMGESGTIGVTPALVNAVMDALSGYGIRHLDMPLTAEKIWTAIQESPAPPVPAGGTGAGR